MFDAGTGAPSVAVFPCWQHKSLSCSLARNQPLLQLLAQDVISPRMVLVTFGAALVVVVGVVWAVVSAWPVARAVGCGLQEQVFSCSKLAVSLALLSDGL
jgi:hypothetical protein